MTQLVLLLQASLLAAALQTEQEEPKLLPHLLPLLMKEEADAYQVPSSLTRRAALGGAAATAATFALPALADDEAPVVAPPPAPPAPPPAPKLTPAEYKLKKSYPDDAKALLTNMAIATQMARGTPNMESIVQQTRTQMIDFVSFYRRQPKVAGMPSFSTLYTAVNTLSGHYASYGNKYPVPEKRRTRLQQQYKEIERALARGK